MAQRRARYFYPRQERTNQVDGHNQDNTQQAVPDAQTYQPRGFANGPRRGGRGASGRGRGASGRGRGRGDRPTSEVREGKENSTTDNRNDWAQLCSRHRKLREVYPDLPCFKIAEDIHEAVITKTVQKLPHLKDLNGELDPRDYVEPLKQLLECEEVHQAIEMRKFDMVNKQIDIDCCCIDFPGLSNGQPSLVTGDIVIIHNDDFVLKELFHIVTTKGDKIILSQRKVDQNRDLLKNPLNISLVSSGTSFDACRRALDKSTEPFIQELISEQKISKLGDFPTDFYMTWTKEELMKTVGCLGENTWLKTLLTSDIAQDEVRKTYHVNPPMWPVLRGYPYDPSTDEPLRYVMNRVDVERHSEEGYVLMQSPSSLKTVIIPFKYSSVGDELILDRDRCNANREFFHEGTHDVIIVSNAMVEAANLTEPMRPSVQPSLRDLFHESKEDLECRLNNRSPKIDLSGQNFKTLDDRLEQLNEPQRQAVLAIMEARYRPRPYILFGPPGTGKTHTLVEACVQIYKRDDVARILFCANSNTCADQISEKLERTGLIDINGLERIRAGDRVSGINFRRIIVTTNIKSAGLMSQLTKFDYVFLDEAGHAHEPESLIPICSLDQRNGCMVLAGDPKQLGPVVQCQQANDLGLGTSMLERIFKFKVYEKQQAYGRYNKFFITKLLHCYRCDPDILEIPNKLFYDNELLYVNQTPKSLLGILNLKKSVQFRHVNGSETKPEWSTSWRNFQEVEVCVNILMRLYKMGFDADQIGLITPYKLQSKEIVKRLKSVISGSSRLLNARFPNKIAERVERDAADGVARDLERLTLDWPSVGEDAVATEANAKDYKIVWNDFRRDWLCKIDTVDAFQGNEREVIVISTVRTGSNRQLDFLNDARRFNVAVSRAKWLVIVVGDKNIIRGGNYWSRFYELAEKNDISQWPHIPPGSEDPNSNLTPLFKRRDPSKFNLSRVVRESAVEGLQK